MRKMTPIIILSIFLTLIKLVPAYAVDPTAPADASTVPPASPTGVTVSGVKDTTAHVAWDPVPYAKQYSIYVNGNRWMGSTGPGVELTGLQPNSQYSVYVTAANDVGESGPSSSISFMTLPPPPTMPDTPVVSQVTDSSASVTWEAQPPYQQIKVYRLYVDGQPVADMQPQAGGLQAANLQNLTPGVHSVAVAGVNDYGEGPRSTPAQFNIRSIPAPTGLQLYNHSADTLWLTWDKSEGVATYQVLINGQKVGETPENIFLVKGLQPSQAYQVGLVAIYSDGNVSNTATIQAYTTPAPEEITINSFIGAINPYLNDLMPAFTIVFAIGAAFMVARAARTIFRGGRLRII